MNKTGLMMMVGVFAGGLMSLSAAEPVHSVDDVRSALGKWVDTRKVISMEQRDWALGKEMMTERIDLLQREIDTLRAKIKETQDSIKGADKKREEMVVQNESLKAAADNLSQMTASLEIRMNSLLVKLPDPIRERVKPLSQRLPASAGVTKLSFSERFQNIVGILNEVNKFNREVNMASEVRALPDGTTAEVTAVYVGIGQGYYASADGKNAGIGSVTPNGWVWEPANEIAPQVSTVISILKNEQVAEFVQLPVVIQ